jgi:intein-encoded DNA endonuclease-like protein
MPQRKTEQEVREVVRLHKNGISQNQIHKTLGFDRTTIRQILKDPEDYIEKSIPEFSFDYLDKKTYSFLLAAYLGDGYIVKTHRKNVFKMRIFCDVKYQNILNEISQSLEIVFPNSKSLRRQHTSSNCIEVYLYSSHLLKLFPQHGEGRKHERPIVLENWQQEIIDEYPVEFLKGLIYTDGSFYFSGKYEYCNFTNKSMDIMKLCSDTMKKLDINHKIRIKNAETKYYSYIIDIQNRNEMAKIPFRKS